MPSERAHATQIVNVCNAFAQNGVEVDLVVSNRPTGIDQTVETYYGQPLRFKIIKYNTFNAVHWGSLFYYLSAFITALKVVFHVRKHSYDIVYGRDEFMLFVLSWFVDIDRFVFESHLASYNFFIRFLIRKGVKVVVISEGIYDEYLTRGVPKEQMMVAHDGIDDSFFGVLPPKAEVRKHLGIPQEVPIAMYIGGFDSGKGIDTFCQAAYLTPDVTFVAIGGSRKDVARYRELYPDVQFLGMRPYSELALNQQAADALVIPNTAKNNVSSRYTSPLKLFAHMTSRVPIVASRVPSITNVLSEDSVYYFEPDNPNALSSVIERVMVEYDKARIKAEKLFLLSRTHTWQARTEKILARLG